MAIELQYWQMQVPALPKRTVQKETMPITLMEDETYKTLPKLNPNKSPGPDEPNPKFFREVAKEINAPLTYSE